MTTVHGNGLKLSWNYLTYSKVHGNLHLFCTFCGSNAPILNLEVASWNSFGQRPRNASLDYRTAKLADLFGPLEIPTLCLFLTRVIHKNKGKQQNNFKLLFFNLKKNILFVFTTGQWQGTIVNGTWLKLGLNHLILSLFHKRLGTKSMFFTKELCQGIWGWVKCFSVAVVGVLLIQKSCFEICIKNTV